MDIRKNRNSFLYDLLRNQYQSTYLVFFFMVTVILLSSSCSMLKEYRENQMAIIEQNEKLENAQSQNSPTEKSSSNTSTPPKNNVPTNQSERVVIEEESNKISNIDIQSENPGADSGSSRRDDVVPKAQYDELKRKYLELLSSAKEMALSQKNNPVSSSGQNFEKKTNEIGGLKPELIQEKNQLSSHDLINEIDKKIVPESVSNLDEIPSLQKNSEINSETRPSLNSESKPEILSRTIEVNDSDETDDEIKKIRNVHALIRVQKHSEAFQLIKTLEKSKNDQVRVRAKFLLGDLLSNQGEYDLALKLYEEILNNHSFSGLVIPSLTKLVSISEKLKLPEKQNKYFNILQLFETGN